MTAATHSATKSTSATGGGPAGYATADDAKAMLDRAVAALKGDPAGAIAQFNKPNGAFRDRDLYVFCADAGSGTVRAHPTLVGADVRTLIDKNGKAFGREMLAAARDGQIAKVNYVWPRVAGSDPIAKESFVTKVGAFICGVGYYK